MGPAAAAAVLIASGTIAAWSGMLLSLSPVRFLGRISYSLYLWHWPILVLVPLAVGTPLGQEVRGALVLAAIAVAWVSWQFVEEPIHRGRSPSSSARGRAIATGLAAILAIVMIGSGLEMRGQQAIDEIALGPRAGPTPPPTSRLRRGQPRPLVRRLT